MAIGVRVLRGAGANTLDGREEHDHEEEDDDAHDHTEGDHIHLIY